MSKKYGAQPVPIQVHTDVKNFELTYDGQNMPAHVEAVLDESPLWTKDEGGNFHHAIGDLTVSIHVDRIAEVVRVERNVTGPMTDTVENLYKQVVHAIFDNAYVRAIEAQVQKMGKVQMRTQSFDEVHQRTSLRIQVAI